MHVNHLENLDLSLEHDEGHQENEVSEAAIGKVSNRKLVFCADDSDLILDNCSYLWVDPNYVGQLSPGQEKLYSILTSIQEGTVYSITTLGRLTKAQGLQNPLACSERLWNLQSLGAISGYKG